MLRDDITTDPVQAEPPRFIKMIVSTKLEANFTAVTRHKRPIKVTPLVHPEGQPGRKIRQNTQKDTKNK
jgi:hypothetical protein